MNMAFIEGRTLGVLISLLAGIMLFNGLINAPYVGDFIMKYPYVIIGTALVIIIFSAKIADKIPFMDLRTGKDALHILAGILLFNGLIRIPVIIGDFKTYPVYIIIIGILLLMFKHKIEQIGA